MYLRNGSLRQEAEGGKEVKGASHIHRHNQCSLHCFPHVCGRAEQSVMSVAVLGLCNCSVTTWCSGHAQAVLALRSCYITTWCSGHVQAVDGYCTGASPGQRCVRTNTDQADKSRQQQLQVIFQSCAQRLQSVQSSRDLWSFKHFLSYQRSD